MFLTVNDFKSNEEKSAEERTTKSKGAAANKPTSNEGQAAPNLTPLAKKEERKEKKLA